MRYALLLGLSVLLFGCSTTGGGAPVADVTPLTLDFGTLEVGDWLILEVEVRNAGSAQLNVTAAEITGAAEDSPFTSGGAAMALRANEAGAISVSFRPLVPGEFAATLRFETNGPREPLFEIPLTGIATAAALSVDPEAVDFGTRAEGCQDTETVTLTNTGDAPLVGLEVDVTGDDEGFELEGADEPFDLEPAASVTLTGTWDPTAEEALNALLVVTQGNDELASIPLAGQSTELKTSESDQWDVPTVSEIDFLWVIDTGLTMDTVQTRLGNGVSELMDELEDQFYDFRFAVVSADKDRGAELLAPVITPTTTDREQAFADAVTQTGGSGQPGFGMEMGWNALNPPLTDVGGPNEGILRPGAGLAVVFVSTGVDASDILGGSGEAFRDAFIALKADPAMVSISLITGAETGCNTAGIAASQTPEYLAAAWRGQVQSVCTNPMPLWPHTYSGPHQKSAFPLDPPALPSSVELAVTLESGDPGSADGWTYDADNEWIVFADGSLPPFESSVEASWARADVCE
ncbi:MAG: choice-of-anchor D domain-containing protein [Deltaproteobacteria bacterium]|nr:choice-of-anchor D domain-containing protein [Deltaproteobacteria bacterium]